MDEPQILAILIIIGFVAVGFFGAWFLIYRIMKRNHDERRTTHSHQQNPLD